MQDFIFVCIGYMISTPPHGRKAQGCGGKDYGDGGHGRKDGELFVVLAYRQILGGSLDLGRASYGLHQQFQQVGGLSSR